MSMNNEEKFIDINKELDELPSLIAYYEEQLENCILSIDNAKSEKDLALSQTLLDYQFQPTVVQKAMYKKTLSQKNKEINEIKTEMSKHKIALNKAKNRFQSIRKIASMRIEEMKHGLEYNNGGEVKK